MWGKAAARRGLSLSEAVDAGEPLGKEAHEERPGEADDIEIVAFDAVDERTAAALNRVSACAALPLAGCDVRSELARRQLAEGDPRGDGGDDFPGRSHEAEAGDDGVCPPRELVQHPLGVARTRRLPVDAPTDRDGRVDAEYRPALRLVCHRARLSERVRAHE